MQQTANPFLLNAFFSLASGLVMLLAADWLASALITTDPILFLLVGGVLIGFAGMIFFGVSRGLPTEARALGLFITLQDGLWVLLTTAAMAYFWAAFTAAGVAALMIVNLIVAGFGLAQWRAMTPAAAT